MKLLHYISWRNWAIFDYNSCIENIFLFFYIALIKAEYGWNFVTNFFLFYLLSVFSVTYGYLTNDLSDIALDRLQNKQNVFENDSKLKARMVVFIFFLLANMTAYPFFKKKHFLMFWYLWVFVATFYSLRPLRFKEKGGLGLLIVVAAQRILPALLIFSAFDYPITPYTSILIIYIANRGFISDVRHQIEDLKNDLATQTKTFAVKAGNKNAKRIFFYLINIDLLIFGIFMFAFFTRLPLLEIGKLKIQFFTIFFFAYITSLVIYLFRRFIGRKGKTTYDPHYEIGYLNLFHLGIPSIFLPLWLLIFLCLKFPGNILILIFFIMLITKMFSVERLKYIFLWPYFKKIFKMAWIWG